MLLPLIEPSTLTPVLKVSRSESIPPEVAPPVVGRPKPLAKKDPKVPTGKPKALRTINAAVKAASLVASSLKTL
jgi:hypothetical protein